MRTTVTIDEELYQQALDMADPGMTEPRFHHSKSIARPTDKNTMLERKKTMCGTVAHNLRLSGSGSSSSP